MDDAAQPGSSAGQPKVGDGAAGEGRLTRVTKLALSALAGVVVVGLAAVQLGDGPTIAGVPLQQVPVDQVSGFERLFTDELVVLLIWGAVLLAAFLVASLVRGMLDDRWLRRFGTGGAEIGDTAGVEAALDVKQSRVLAELIAQVTALERDAVADREAVAEVFGAMETLSEELDQARAARDR